MHRAYVLGVGMTKFAKHPELTFEEMGVEAIREALADAEIDIKQVQAAYCGHGFSRDERRAKGYGEVWIFRFSNDECGKRVREWNMCLGKHFSQYKKDDMIFVWLWV